MLTVQELTRVLLPVGALTKQEVRARAASLGLPTADKPDSQEVCFVAAGPGQGPRERFLAQRIELHPGRLVDRASGSVVGTVAAVELVTVGQRRGLGFSPSGRRYALEIDAAAATVTVGSEEDLLTDEVELTTRTWVAGPLGLGGRSSSPRRAPTVTRGPSWSPRPVCATWALPAAVWHRARRLRSMWRTRSSVRASPVEREPVDAPAATIASVGRAGLRPARTGGRRGQNVAVSITKR